MNERGESRHVLIVEDEFLVAMHLESVLGDLGFIEVRWANSLASAERDLENGPPAFAILDINIGRELVFPFAEQLEKLSVPFLFSSGGAQPLPAQLAHHPFVAKPLDAKDLAATIKTICPSLIPTEPRAASRLLGHVLYANTKPPAPEHEWVTLVQSISAGDQLALHRLYERSHHLVYTLISRITGDRKTAEELSIDVFYDIWHGASDFDAEKNTVLGWIMNRARSHAMKQSEHGAARIGDGQATLARQDDAGAVRAQARVALRIAMETGQQPVLPPAAQWVEPDWEDVAPGIACKLLATDAERHKVSMLVRLTPGASYPAHTHAGDEELHLLDGELWIDERRLSPGDYNYAPPGSGDDRVWSETGCTCVLVTSTQDILR